MWDKEDIVRLKHMLDACQEAFFFAKNKSRESLAEDKMLLLALVKSLEIIGEAAAKLSEECRGELSHIPWLNIINMRNRLIHAYFDVNLDVVWNTVSEDLPPGRT